ncbi:MAG: SCP2 sterol-binding domain-containing protein [Deltaproteobacteria bacterium]
MTEQELKQGTPTDQAEESEPQPSTDERLSEIFSAFEEYGAAGATESHTCLFRLTGDAGGDYLLTTADGKATVKKDGSGDADITVTLPAEDLVRMADGDFDGRLAVASERIEIDGDLELAAALLGIIEPEEA